MYSNLGIEKHVIIEKSQIIHGSGAIYVHGWGSEPVATKPFRVNSWYNWFKSGYDVTILFLGSALFLISSFRATVCLLSQDPFVTLTITISLSWVPSHSLYTPFNPYTIPCITTRQGVLFAYLFLVMDNYSFSRFSHICCVFLLLILLSITFHDLPFLLSGMFYLVPSCSFAYSADLLLSI